MPKKRPRKHGKGQQSSAGSGMSTSREISDRQQKEEAATPRASDSAQAEGVPQHTSSSDCDELSLWKVSERMNRSQAHQLGVKLGMSSTKLENLNDKVQRKICSQEEMNFEMLHKWNANQVPDDDPEAKLCQMLKDLEIPDKTVQEMFTKENHLHQATQERVLNQQQLYQIAEKVDKSQHIPIVLRLGLNFNDLELTKQRCCNHADYFCLFKLLLEWQRDLPPRIDQIETMSSVLSASEQKRLAYNIRNNCWNVISGDKGRSIMLGTETRHTFCDMDLIITCCDPAKQEQILSRVKSVFEKCSSKVELSSHGETCTLDKSTERVKKVHDECQDVSRFLSDLQEAGTRANMYEMNGVTVSSIILHVRVYSEEGLRRLREDVDSGAVGRRLANVLMLHETGASSDDEILDVTLAAGTIDHISQQSAGISLQRMENWGEEEVKVWLRSVVLFPENIVSKFDDIDGFTLLRYTTDQLQADFGLSIVNCRKLEHRLQERLEKEGMEGSKILSNVTSLGGRTEEEHALESQTLPKQERSTVTHDDAMHVGPSIGKKIRDTAESSLESPEKVQSGVSPVSSYVPKGDVKPKVKEPKFSKESEKKLAQLLIGSDKGQLDASYYPVLIANAPSEQIITEKELNEKFGFMSSVNWNVVFDCNPESNDTGLCSIVTKKRRIRILSPKDFQTKDYDKQKEDIEFPEVPVWLYPNGRRGVKECEEGKLPYDAWIRDRSYAVSNAVRFFSDPEVIPPGRAVVIFLLLSDSDIMVMTQIFREFYTSDSFRNLQYFTFLAEDEDVVQKWVDSLKMQQIVVESSELKCRCLSGVPWQEINTYMLRLLGTCETTVPQLPMSPRGACELKHKHQSQWTDISVLARNECENTSMDDKNPNFPDFVREKEEKFYRGHEVDWWNFHLSEGKGNGYNHVLRRDSFNTLSSKVNNMLTLPKKNITHLSLVTVFHEPGSGGTTMAKKVLWELHKEYRCAVVNRVTNDTVNQIMALRRYNYEKSDKPAPVVILLDNLDSESMSFFLINLEREAKNVTDEGLAVLLLHCKRTNEPENFLANDENQPCVAVQHKLSQRERDWFRKKTEDLEKRGFAVKDIPEQLLAFMMMKGECRPEYIQAVVKRILPVQHDCRDEEQKALVILKYIAAMNKYCAEFAMPVSACDQYMQKTISFTLSMTSHKKRPWEKERPKVLELLLTEVIIPDIDGCAKGLGIAHYTLAEEILSQLCKFFNQTPADIFLEFLMTSPILDTKSYSKEYMKRTCRNIMIRRMMNQFGDVKTDNFSRLIEDAYKEDKSKAFKILEVGIQKFEDPFIAQHKARLHRMYDHDYDQAEQSIDLALDLMQGKNPYLWDTKGIILREKMTDFEQTKTQGPLSDEDIKTVLRIFEDACFAFQNSQAANTGEVVRNNCCFLDEITTIFKFLDVIQKRVEPFSCGDEGLEKMRKYLTTDFIPSELISHALQDYHSVLKSLPERVKTVLGCVTDSMTHCAWPWFHFTPNKITERMLEEIYAGRNRYFGLTFQYLPSYHQESNTASVMRRAEVTRQIGDGYHCIFDMASAGKVDKLQSIQALLKTNLDSQPYLFDVRSLVLVSFALGVCSEEYFDEDKTRHWVQILKELEEETDGFYGLFFEMILNWPDRTLNRSDIPPIKDTIRKLEHKWRKKYNPVHNLDVPSISHKRSRICQSVYPLKAATDFYLGKQDRFRLIHRSKIGNITHAGWEEQEVRRLLSSLTGVLVDQHHLIYNPQGEPMTIPLDLPVQGLPSREPVTFFLGFSFSGPVAYDVRYLDEREISSSSREARVSFPGYIMHMITKIFLKC